MTEVLNCHLHYNFKFNDFGWHESTTVQVYLKFYFTFLSPINLGNVKVEHPSATIPSLENGV